MGGQIFESLWECRQLVSCNGENARRAGTVAGLILILEGKDLQLCRRLVQTEAEKS